MQKKIVNPGKIHEYNDKLYNVFCEIIYDDKEVLHIVGVVGPRKSGNCVGGCGQINPVKIDKFADGWNQETLNVFNAIWEKYHLNDLHAECEHQELLGWAYNTHAGKHCPICDYEIGTAWTKREIPVWVIDWLFDLPNTEIEPAWV